MPSLEMALFGPLHATYLIGAVPIWLSIIYLYRFGMSDKINGLTARYYFNIFTVISRNGVWPVIPEKYVPLFYLPLIKLPVRRTVHFVTE